MTTVREQLIRLLGAFDQSLGDRRLDQWTNELSMFEGEQIRAVVDGILRDKEIRGNKITLRDILSRLPDPTKEKTGREPGWWSPDGDWGGEWRGVPAFRKLIAAATMEATKIVIPEDGDEDRIAALRLMKRLNAERESRIAEFHARCQKADIPWRAIEAAAQFVKQRGGISAETAKELLEYGTLCGVIVL